MVSQAEALTPQGIEKLKGQYSILLTRYAHVVHDLDSGCGKDCEVCQLKRLEEKILSGHIKKLKKFLDDAQMFAGVVS